MNSSKFIIDVETTGTNPSKGVLLSVGILALDDQLNAIADYEIDINASEDELILYCNEEVTAMHKKSGLWDRCINSSNTLADAQGQILEFMETYRADKKKAILINNNPAFDMAWLRQHMPFVAGLFGYRMVDISSINILARQFKPELAARVRDNKTYSHVALDDCYESLGELKLYINEIFKK